MANRPRRARRVQLSTPGSSEKMMQKASESKADHVFLDLEDAVAPSQKRDARKKIVEALKTLNWKGKTRCVRINDLTTEYAYEDIIEIVEGAGEHLDTIMMTKVQTAADILFADKLLNQMEKKLKLKNSIGLEALIEEVEGMQNVDEIAKSTPRLECLVFGMGDFSASMGVTNKNVGESDGYPGDIWHYARFRLVMACRAAGMDAIDVRLMRTDLPAAAMADLLADGWQGALLRMKVRPNMEKLMSGSTLLEGGLPPTRVEAVLHELTVRRVVASIKPSLSVFS